MIVKIVKSLATAISGTPYSTGLLHKMACFAKLGLVLKIAFVNVSTGLPLLKGLIRQAF